MIYVYDCHKQEDTEALAKSFAQICKKSDVWALFGTLGVGKSVFSRAFIKKLVDVDDVPSPTFTLVQVYPSTSFDIYHYDLYRLKSAEEIWELNIEEAIYENVCLIEWPEKMGIYLPKDCFKVNISMLSSTSRRVEIEVFSEEKKNRLLQATVKPDKIYER